MPRKSLAKNNPALKTMEQEAVEVGQAKPRTLKAEGPASEALESHTIEVERGLDFKNKADELQFNEEVLTVVIHDSTNPSDDPLPLVIVNGMRQYFERGKQMKVKRKFVERLARARKTTYSQEELPNRAGYRNVPHTALQYPFSVIHDPAGYKGAEWLQAILNEQQV